jgi:hypothetical protein
MYFGLRDNIKIILFLRISHNKFLRVYSLLLERYNYAPSPTYCFTIILLGYFNESARDKEWNNIFRKTDYFIDSKFHIDFLFFELSLFFKSLLPINLNRPILSEGLFKFLLELREFSLVLELVETLHYNIFWVNILYPHHIKQHVIPKMEGRIEGI